MKGRTFSPIEFEWNRDGELTRFVQKGRNAWALSRLIATGPNGVTPVSEPTGPRWSAYIFNLRQVGLSIETRTESHSGPFAGNHARYVLTDEVRIIRVVDGDVADA